MATRSVNGNVRKHSVTPNIVDKLLNTKPDSGDTSTFGVVHDSSDTRNGDA